MNDEMNMNEFHDEVTDEVTLDVADEPQIIDLTEPDDILADEDAAPVTNPWRRPGQSQRSERRRRPDSAVCLVYSF